MVVLYFFVFSYFYSLACIPHLVAINYRILIGHWRSYSMVSCDTKGIQYVCFVDADYGQGIVFISSVLSLKHQNQLLMKCLFVWQIGSRET